MLPELLLILLPGTHGTAELYQPLVRALSPTVRCEVAVLPPQPVRSYADLDPWIASVTHGKGPYVLVGESFSSALAIRYAATQPPGLKGLVTLGGFAQAPARWWMKLAAGLAPSFTAPILAPLRRRMIFGDEGTEEDDALLVKAMEHYTLETLRSRVAVVFSADEREALRKITVPRLAIQGTEDRMIPRKAYEVLVGSGFKSGLIEQGPHAVAYKSTSATARWIQDWLEDSF